jgi:AmmeMemoRadiSam system protein B
MSGLRIRKPIVAGQFYPSSAQDIKKQLRSFISADSPRKDAIACVLPHAGYIYSGRVAAETVSRLNLKEKIVLLGPNHTGYGQPYSVMTQGAWQTPMGEIEIDTALAERILQRSKFLKEDALAQAYEHSLEVELPILQYFKSDFKIVPITILSDDPVILKEIGRAIADAVKELDCQAATLIIASSDMTHYEPAAYARKKDEQAIKAILGLNENELAAKVQELNITMCGWAPVIAMLAAAKQLGASKAELIKYQTSGDITGDQDSVVGYAGMVIT